MSSIHNHNFSIYFTSPALKNRVLINPDNNHKDNEEKIKPNLSAGRYGKKPRISGESRSALKKDGLAFLFFKGE
jgi:hypothetical protein